VAKELRLVGGDVLDADTMFVAADFNDAVDQQKGIAVRKRGEDFANPYGFNGFSAHISSPPSSDRKTPLANPARRRLPAPVPAGLVGHCVPIASLTQRPLIP
jgi:hypothetical protein